MRTVGDHSLTRCVQSQDTGHQLQTQSIDQTKASRDHSTKLEKWAVYFESPEGLKTLLRMRFQLSIDSYFVRAEGIVTVRDKQ